MGSEMCIRDRWSRGLRARDDALHVGIVGEKACTALYVDRKMLGRGGSMSNDSAARTQWRERDSGIIVDW